MQKQEICQEQEVIQEKKISQDKKHWRTIARIRSLVSSVPERIFRSSCVVLALPRLHCQDNQPVCTGQAGVCGDYSVGCRV